MHRLHRVRYWLWLPDDGPSAAFVRGVLAGVGFHDMTTLECHRFYGPWRWQEVTQHSIAHWCEEVRHYVEPCGALLVDFQVLEQ